MYECICLYNSGVAVNKIISTKECDVQELSVSSTSIVADPSVKGMQMMCL